MRLRAGKQVSETFWLGALLAVAGGFLDAYTYLVRGGVFANAQTGNMVLMGLRLAEGEWAAAARYLVPILAFALGVLAAEAVRTRFLRHPAVHWRQLTVLAELVVLAGVAFLPRTLDTAANVAVAFVCALQVESFRKVNGNAFATTMCTGNLRSGTECLFRFLHTRERKDGARCLQYYGIILFFIAGAAAGVPLSARFGARAALFGSGVLLSAFLLMFIRSGDADREP